MRERKFNAVSRRLATIPGIGPIQRIGIAATIVDPTAFKSEFAARIGLAPCAHSSGGKQKLGRVSKRGDGICGACSRLGQNNRGPVIFIENQRS
jgi:transposase